jgi:predicted DNA binding CopG/RHH family protein
MNNTKKAKAPKLPQHWSEAKNEAEEAAWWDANAERLTREAAQRGTLKMGTLEQLLADMKAQRDQTRLLSLRISVGDIALAKAQAEKKGMGYQTYLKSVLHQALVGAGLTAPQRPPFGFAMRKGRRRPPRRGT